MLHKLCSLVVCTLVSVEQFFFLMIRRPPRSTLDRSSAASDVYKRQVEVQHYVGEGVRTIVRDVHVLIVIEAGHRAIEIDLSLIHISEPTRPY